MFYKTVIPSSRIVLGDLWLLAAVAEVELRTKSNRDRKVETTLSTCLLFPNGRRFISRKTMGVARGTWRQIPSSVAPHV